MFGRAVRAAVLDAGGPLDLLACAVVQTAMRWEKHARLAGRWLRKEGDKLTPDQRLAFSRDIAIRGVAAGADRDQARLLADAIARLVALNPWLDQVLEVQAWSVKNRHTGSELSVISSDAGSSFGLLIDFAAIDELSHWSNGGDGQALWESLLSAVAKKSVCMVVAISNAGLGAGSSWQWKARESFRENSERENSETYFSRLDGPIASWMTADRLDWLREMLTVPAYDRLVENRWQSGSSDLLADAEMLSAITLPGPSERERNVKYVAGCDLGLTKNSASLVVVGKLGTRVKLVRAWEWKPSRGIKVSIDAIEEEIVKAHRHYGFVCVGADPWNSAQLVERCKKKGVPIRERAQSGKHLVEQAAALLEAFNTRSLDLYDHPQLLRDLRQARLEEKSYGVRIVSPEVNGSHGDVLSAFTIALAIAREVVTTTGTWGHPLQPGPPPATTLRGGSTGNPYGEPQRSSGWRPGVYHSGKLFW
jgi:phage terminase large subunit-like protein